MSQYNPYAAPQAAPPAPVGMPMGGGGPQPWEIGEIIGHAWRVFGPNWATLVFTQFLAGIIAAVPNQLPAVLVLTHAIEQGSDEYWITYSVSMFVGIVIQTFFQAGLLKVWLDASRGVTPQFGDMFRGAGRFLPLLGATLIFWLGLTLGCGLLIVPGVLFLCGFALTTFFVVDQKMGPIEAMGASWRATSGQKGQIFLFLLVAGLMFIAGYLACCIGVFVAVPLVMVAYATIYTRLTGTSGIAQPPGFPPPGYGPPGGGYGPPPGGGYGGPPGGGYGPPGGGGYGGPPAGGGYGGPPAGGGYGGPPGGGGYGPPGGGGYGGPPGGGYGPPGGGGYGPR